MKKTAAALALVSAGAALALLLPALSASSQDLQSVLVTNFPTVQKVDGRVAVEGTVRHASLVRLAPAVAVAETLPEPAGVVDGGVLETDGYTGVSLSLVALLQGKAKKTGEVGALLVPDEEAIVEAFQEGKLDGLILRVSAEVTPGHDFTSGQVRLPVGFPRYRVYYYDTGDRSAAVRLFGYLVNGG